MLFASAELRLHLTLAFASEQHVHLADITRACLPKGLRTPEPPCVGPSAVLHAVHMLSCVSKQPCNQLSNARNRSRLAPNTTRPSMNKTCSVFNVVLEAQRYFSFSPPPTHLALLLFNIAFNMMHALVNTRSATFVRLPWLSRLRVSCRSRRKKSSEKL